MTAPENNVDKIRALRDGAQAMPPLQEPDDRGPDDDDGERPDARRGDEKNGGDLFLPKGCPVVALGVNGDWYYYLDQLGQFRELKAKDHSRLNVQSMFGRLAELLYGEDYWPRYSKDPDRKGQLKITGWKPELAAEALMGSAAVKGVWNPNERVRGAGAWRDADGELILHVGDQLLVVPADNGSDDQKGPRGWKVLEPGVIGRMVYPTFSAGLKPAPAPQPMAPHGPGDKALQLFSTWNWRRKDLDPFLLLGWIGCAMMGGAINWRPLAWTTGGFGTGKSSLQEAVKWCFGDNGLLHTSDTSAAGVRQVLKHSSLPVAIDEAEAEEDQRRMQQLIKLARDAATGALAIRGGSDHVASQFTIRSCFLFTSILIPSLLPQDRSRIAILELDQLDPQKPIPADITPQKMGELGGQLLRRLVDQWGRWQTTIELYRDTLGRAGHSARGQDVFGSLLAAMDLLLYDTTPDSDTLAAWQQRLAVAGMAELEGAVHDQEACLTHLMSTVVEDSHNRKRFPIGHWIGRACGKFDGCKDEQCGYASDVLQEWGVKLHYQGGLTYVAIANMHRGLARIFEGTQWGARPGAMGVWVQALRRLEGAERSRQALWFGATSRATLLPLALCLPVPPGKGGTQDASAAAETAATGAAPDLASVHAEGGAGPAASPVAERSAADTAGLDYEALAGRRSLDPPPDAPPDVAPGAGDPGADPGPHPDELLP